MKEAIKAVRIYFDGKNALRQLPVFLYYTQPATVAEAIERVRAHKTAFVRTEDADAVMAALVTGDR